MKKLLFISVASLAMVFSSCGKKAAQDAPAEQAAPATEEVAPAAAEEAVVAPSAMEQLQEIAKLVEAAATSEDLKAAAEKYNEFKANIQTVAAALSEADKTQLSDLFKAVGENIMKKELELNKK